VDTVIRKMSAQVLIPRPSLLSLEEDPSQTPANYCAQRPEKGRALGVLNQPQHPLADNLQISTTTATTSALWLVILL
jgi:hypothetical protein